MGSFLKTASTLVQGLHDSASSQEIKEVLSHAVRIHVLSSAQLKHSTWSPRNDTQTQMKLSQQSTVTPQRLHVGSGWRKGSLRSTAQRIVSLARNRHSG